MMLDRLAGNDALKEEVRRMLAGRRLSHSLLLIGEQGLGAGFAARCIAADYLYPAGGPAAEALLRGECCRAVAKAGDRDSGRIETGVVREAISVEGMGAGGRYLVGQVTAMRSEIFNTSLSAEGRAVLLYHADPSWLPGGFFGVSVARLYIGVRHDVVGALAHCTPQSRFEQCVACGAFHVERPCSVRAVGLDYDCLDFAAFASDDCFHVAGYRARHFHLGVAFVVVDCAACIHLVAFLYVKPWHHAGEVVGRDCKVFARSIGNGGIGNGTLQVQVYTFFNFDFSHFTFHVINNGAKVLKKFIERHGFL